MVQRKKLERKGDIAKIAGKRHLKDMHPIGIGNLVYPFRIRIKIPPPSEEAAVEASLRKRKNSLPIPLRGPKKSFLTPKKPLKSFVSHHFYTVVQTSIVRIVI